MGQVSQNEDIIDRLNDSLHERGAPIASRHRSLIPRTFWLSLQNAREALDEFLGIPPAPKNVDHNLPLDKKPRQKRHRPKRPSWRAIAEPVAGRPFRLLSKREQVLAKAAAKTPSTLFSRPSVKKKTKAVKQERGKPRRS